MNTWEFLNRYLQISFECRDQFFKSTYFEAYQHLKISHISTSIINLSHLHDVLNHCGIRVRPLEERLSSKSDKILDPQRSCTIGLASTKPNSLEDFFTEPFNITPLELSNCLDSIRTHKYLIWKTDSSHLVIHFAACLRYDWHASLPEQSWSPKVVGFAVRDALFGPVGFVFHLAPPSHHQIRGASSDQTLVLKVGRGKTNWLRSGELGMLTTVLRFMSILAWKRKSFDLWFRVLGSVELSGYEIPKKKSCLWAYLDQPTESNSIWFLWRPVIFK